MIKNMNFRLALIFIAAAIFIIYPIYSLVVLGPFSWHVTQPAAWQGALELVILFCFFYYSLIARTPFKKYAFFLIPALIYSRRHGVDISIVLIYLYVEAIFSLGWTFMPYIGAKRTPRPANYFLAGFVGLTFWLLIVWVFSAAGLGSVKAIQIITFSILGPVLLFSNAPRLVNLVSPWLKVEKPVERASVTLIAILFFALFAKISASSTINFDAMWYGLQLEKSMLGEGSIFTGQGLVALVHYYPKLYESLLIPFSGLGSLSLPMGIGVFSWLLVVLTSFAILREFRVNRTFSILVTALVATIPALANTAITTKGDVFAAWLGLLGLLFLLRFNKTGCHLWFWACLSALAFAPLSRLSVLPYVAIVVIFLFIDYYSSQSHSRKSELSQYVLPVLAGVVVLLVVLRTYLLSGVPFIAPAQLVNLANQFGMYIDYPVGSVTSVGRSRIPLLSGAWSYLFSPANVLVLLISWIGNIWIFIPLATLTLSHGRRLTYSKDSLVLLIAGLTFPVILFTRKFHSAYGADGNYFILPIVFLLIFGALLLKGLDRYVKNFLAWIMLAFAISSSAIIFVTGSWGPGSRAFDMVFKRLPFELDTHQSNVLKSENIIDIYNFFKVVPSGSRVVGFEDPAVRRYPIGWSLPVRYEPIQTIKWWRPSLLSSSQSFKDFLIRTKIDYVLLSRSNPIFASNSGAENMFLEALDNLKDENISSKVFDNKVYEIWQLSVTNSPTIP